MATAQQGSGTLVLQTQNTEFRQQSKNTWKYTLPRALRKEHSLDDTLTEACGTGQGIQVGQAVPAHLTEAEIINLYCFELLYLG